MTRESSQAILRRFLAEDPPNEDDIRAVESNRPKTRADCAGGYRPCPFVGCRYHLFLEVAGETTGRIDLNFLDKPLEDMEHTCALDVAETFGPCTLEQIGEVLNFTRERARQIETEAFQKLFTDSSILNEIVEEIDPRILEMLKMSE